MSKRKNRNQSPNIPQSTLDRARQQLGQTEEPVAAAPEAKVEKAAPVVEKAAPAVAARPAVERRPRPARSGTSAPRTSRKEEKHDMAYSRQRLANPTRIVTEADLKAEYGYVITDLRAMGILATVLVIALIVIEKIT